MEIDYDGESAVEESLQNQTDSPPLVIENNQLKESAVIAVAAKVVEDGKTVDVWDDTELIRAWNESIDEYRRMNANVNKENNKSDDAANMPGKWTKVPAQRGNVVDLNKKDLGNHAPLSAAEESKGAEQEEQQYSLLTEGIIKILDDKKAKLKQSAQTQSPVTFSGKRKASAVKVEDSEQVKRARIPMQQLQPQLEGMNADLNELLWSWYYAGYHTAKYLEKQQTRQ